MSLHDRIFSVEESRDATSLYERLQLLEALSRAQILRKRVANFRDMGHAPATKKAEAALKAHLASDEGKAEEKRANDPKTQTAWQLRQREFEERERRKREGTLEKAPPQKKKITGPTMAAPPSPGVSQRKPERRIVGFRDTSRRD
jgi:hypothetical protein